MIPRFPVYLFDIDGTLLDSAKDICGAIEQVLAGTECQAKGGGPVTFEFLQSYIGLHLIEVFGDVLPHYSSAQIDELVQEYRALYPARGHKLTKLYPGVVETLPVLGGLKSTASTKGTNGSRAILEQFGLLPYFNHVQGTDGFPCKPAPDVILNALAALGAKPADCLMVGDAPSDMIAGKRAGVKTCAVRYGYGKEAELAQYQPDYWVSDLRELIPSDTQ